MHKYNYTKLDLSNALKDAGLKSGDKIFTHGNIGFFGALKEASTFDEFYSAFKEVLFDILGPDGTFIVPTFSYSFCRKEIFDLNETKSTCGILSEMVRRDKESLRSEDANFSVAAIGYNAILFTENVPAYSFGLASFWDRFLKFDGKFCNFNFDSASTFIHYVERELHATYRFDKPFEGMVINKNVKEKRTYYHFCYDLTQKDHMPDFCEFDKTAKALGLTKTVNLGKGQIVSISAQDTFNLIKNELPKNPTFLIKGKTLEV